MRFALATLYVGDMEKSLAFYNGVLGVPVIGRHAAGPGIELAFLGIEGQPSLELIATGEKRAHSGFSVGFEVDDLAAMRKRLAANGYEIEREMTPGNGGTLCFFKGPDGEEVELIG